MSKTKKIADLLQQVVNAIPEVLSEKLSGELLSAAFHAVEPKGPALYLVMPLSTRPLLTSWTTLLHSNNQSLWGAHVLFTDAIQENLGHVFTAEGFSVSFTWDVTPEPGIQKSDEPLTGIQESEELPLEDVTRCPHCGKGIRVTLRKKEMT